MTKPYLRFDEKFVEGDVILENANYELVKFNSIEVPVDNLESNIERYFTAEELGELKEEIFTYKGVGYLYLVKQKGSNGFLIVDNDSFI